METAAFTWWQEDTFFLGYFNEYPDYQTQGMSFDELCKNLKDLWFDVHTAEVPYVKHVSQLVVA